jgi:molybdenum-dependent DNA-binding transcriptional regulator ModE
LVEVCSPAFAVAGGVAGTVAGKQTARQLFNDLAGENVMQMARAGKGRGGNQKPNADVNRIVKEFDLNRTGQRKLHNEITGKNFDLDEIRSIAEELAKQSKYLNRPPR